MNERGSRWRRTPLALAAAVLLPLWACGGGSAGGGTGSDIVIGASLPLSGALAGFGSFQKWGYNHAVDRVNAQGGITIGGQKHRVQLRLLDDQSDPSAPSTNIERLVTSDRAVALLGSCTPALVNPGAVVADRDGIPMVTGCDPLETFKSVKKWTSVWDIFFDEPDLASAPFKLMKDLNVQTNQKVAVLTDNGPDGLVVGGQIWPALAKQFGYTVAYSASFPIDATQFTSVIADTRQSGADVVLVDSLTPNGVAMRKQMAAAGYTPKVLVMEKGGEPVQFAQALGNLANGIIFGGYWDYTFPYPGAAQLRTQFEHETGQTYSQHIADSEAAAEVLLDAIARAGSTDPARINTAIGQTDRSYVVGPVKFDASHTSRLPLAEDQWQNGRTVVVWPKNLANGQFLFPVPAS